MFQFVMHLRSEFEPVRVQLLGRTPLPTLAEALASLITEKTHLRALATTSVISHTVLAAPHRTGVIKASSIDTIVCTHCKKTGHRAQNCFKLHPEHLAEFRTRRSTGSRRGVVTGVSSDPPIRIGASSDPPIRASGSAASMSASGTTTSWVLDSGASFHMTSDGSQLSSCKPAPNGTYIQTVDGTSCSVTHQGILAAS
ncbi:Zinc finger CCHC-type protein [Dioscorea alata]|uniref:Zinc finger CCHC-type protein n=1 Tax=Dioscorea alata TaxID=55571 RepID=A0ACB7UIK9_DIOAL|nr:Zinc finger CCHC-type protein [Dioscorea alata]